MITFQGFGDFLEKNLIITRDELDRLIRVYGEYSCTFPTGVIPGKKWIRREPYGAPMDKAEWLLLEYGPVFERDGKDFCKTIVKKLIVVDQS